MLRIIVLCFLALFISACATIDRGIEDHVRVDTVPQGARVTVTYHQSVNRNPRSRKPLKRYAVEVIQDVCPSTPCAIPHPRQKDALVRIEHEGFAPVEYVVYPSSRSGATAVNLQSTLTGSSATGLYAGAITFQTVSFMNAFGRLFTLGLERNAFGNASGTAASVGTGVGVGVVAVSLATDAVTKANSNLFPNPSVFGLAETESELHDPLVAPFKADMTAERLRADLCFRYQRSDPVAVERCNQAKEDYRRTRRAYLDTKAQAKAEYKALIRAAREQEKTSQP